MLITDPKKLKKYHRDQQIWQGIPGVEVTAKGRIFVSYFSGGIKETAESFSALIMSDDGDHFSEPVAVAYVDGKRCYDPCIWIDPLGRLWFFWTLTNERAVWAAVCDDPDADRLRWGEPFKIGGEVMINKPTVLSTGEWLFPVAVWNYEPRTVSVDYLSDPAPRLSYVFKSSDMGRTIRKLGGADVPQRKYDEHNVVELSDGRLMMLVRTNYGIGVSYSYDRGRSWSKGKNSGIKSPSSRCHFSRLRSGRLLLINHVNFTRRNNLTAMLSDDDGKTWSEGILLDERSQVSYPDAKEAEDGYIYIVYDRERGESRSSLEEAESCARELLMARLTEEDILQGKLVSGGSFLKKVVTKLGAYCGEKKNPFGEIGRMSDREFAEKLTVDHQGKQILDALFLHYPIPRDRELDKLIGRYIAEDYRSTELLRKIVCKARACTVPCDPQTIVDAVVRHASERFTAEYDASALAEQLQMSLYYMEYLFARECGITIAQYYDSLRLTQAKEKLIGTSDPVSVIASDCGYRSASRFNEVFLAEESMTPASYRRLHREG